MLKHILVLGWLCAFGASNYCISQVVTTAVPFMLISQDAEMNGLGEASVARLTPNPLASMSNPAQLGMQSLINYFSSGFNHSDWLPAFEMTDLWYETFAVNTGFRLNKLWDITPDIGVGIGYSRIYLNLGPFSRTVDSPEPVETIDGHEMSNQFTIGLGVNYGIKAAFGMTLKSITSHLAPNGIAKESTTGSAGVTTYDYGFLISVPCVHLLSGAINRPLQIGSGISPIFDLNFGFANNNLGDKGIFYIDPAQADPLPRYARVGWGVNIGLLYKDDDLEWEPCSFHWTREANDILVRLNSQGTSSTGNYWSYQSGLGDIDVYRELILNKANPKTVKIVGWEYNLFDLFSIRRGRFVEDPYNGNRRFNTSGIGIHTCGFFKLLSVSLLKEEGDGIIHFLLRHLDIRYDHSTIKTDESDNPLGNTEYESINIVISN